MSRAARWILNSLGALLVLGLGVMGARGLMADRVQADAAPRPDAGALVRTVVAEAGEAHRVIRASGTVLPARTLLVQPEVQGRVTERHPALEVGGRVREGDVLVRIDARDYRLAVADARTALENARAAVELEAGRAEVARLEWAQFGDEEPSALALREPQRRQAALQVEAARQALQRAEIQLERTVIRASMDGLVQEAGAEVGQFVGPQARIAQLVGTDRFHVQVSVPVADLGWLSIPGVNAPEGEGGDVLLRHGVEERRGRILRLLGEVDPAGRMARVLIAVEDPLHLARAEGERRPLLLGAWVEVEMEATRSQPVVWLPREAVRDGSRMYVVEEGDRLGFRDVEFAWREADRVALHAGVAAGESVVVSRLPAPVAGMRVRPEGAGASPPGAGDSREAATADEAAAAEEAGHE
ncbi:MAG: efflux RND transporter periplasmic adaptor subunit [Deltaproteobacteria bacterium]|nr:MAG: efflux RND transporter periplasmic adaptor subunit [Deltaproteobacteria bacterium]